MQTKALVLNAPRDLTIQEVALPPLTGKDVLIRVKACGVCGTDLHLFHGDQGAFESSYPLIMGHEMAGEIVEVGCEVYTLAPGDHVAVDPNIYCGTCAPCRRGDVHYCENMIGIGTTERGGFAEYCIVPERAAYLVPRDLSFEYAAMMEPISCCLHGLDRSAVRTGDTLVLVGFGAIGQIMFQLGELAGAARIIVVEPVAGKREKARALGAYLAVDPVGGDLAKTLHDHGVTHINSVIECVGRKETMELAIRLATPRATVMLFGLTPPGTKLEVLAFEDIFKKELTITGSYINPLVAERVIALMASGRLDMSKIVTDRVPLERGVEVFTDPAYRTLGKVVIGDFP